MRIIGISTGKVNRFRRCFVRLPALVIATILLISVALLAQRGGGASSGTSHSSGSSGGSSHGGSAGSPGGSRGSVSPSSYSASGRSNSSGAESGRLSSQRSSSEQSFSLSERPAKDPAGTGLNIRPNLLKSPVGEKVDGKPEKKGVFSFLHHKKPAPEPTTWINPRFRCKREQSCGTPTRQVCQTGRVWNSSSCSQYDQYSWFNGCRSLADQLEAEREGMRLGNDPGGSLRYRMMLNQYRQCMSRYGTEPFSSYLFTDASVVPYF
jgi:hypothetical protein